MNPNQREAGATLVSMNLNTTHEHHAHALYAILSDPSLSRKAARGVVDQLAAIVADSVGALLAQGGAKQSRTVVCFILRGALLLMPAFMRSFSDAHFSLVQLHRDPDGRRTGHVICAPKISTPEAVVIADCVAATGATISAAIALLNYDTAVLKIAGVVTATAVAANHLRLGGFALAAISSNEAEINGLVFPDLGSQDAGDLAVDGSVG